MNVLNAVQLSIDQGVAVWISFEIEAWHEVQMSDTLRHQLAVAGNFNYLQQTVSL